MAKVMVLLTRISSLGGIVINELRRWGAFHANIYGKYIPSNFHQSNGQFLSKQQSRFPHTHTCEEQFWYNRKQKAAKKKKYLHKYLPTISPNSVAINIISLPTIKSSWQFILGFFSMFSMTLTL